MPATPPPEEPITLFCDRCSAALHPGTGDYYLVKIEAVADPTPPVITGGETPTNLRKQIEELLESMQDVSAQEAMDQVYRRVTLFLCVGCYREWIEAPTG